MSPKLGPAQLLGDLLQVGRATKRTPEFWAPIVLCHIPCLYHPLLPLPRCWCSTELPAQQHRVFGAFYVEINPYFGFCWRQDQGVLLQSTAWSALSPPCSVPNDSVVKIKVIYSKRIPAPYLMIKPPQSSENKLLVSLSSVYKEGTISWINMKSPPTILSVIRRRLENSTRSRSFHVVCCFVWFFSLAGTSGHQHSGLNQTCLSIHPSVTERAKDAATLRGTPALR